MNSSCTSAAGKVTPSSSKSPASCTCPGGHTNRVLIPAARNGLLAAVLLGVGRAIGETMAVLMATGHAVNIPDSIFDPVRTLTATIAAELGETSQGSPHYQVLFLIGVLLFSITFVVNLLADLIVKGVRRQ